MADAAPIVPVSWRSGSGLIDLWRLIQNCPLRRTVPVEGCDLLRHAQELLARRFTQLEQFSEIQALLERWKKGDLNPAEAAAALLRALGQ